MASEIIKIEDLVPMNEPQRVIEEIQEIVFMMVPGFDFEPVVNVFNDVLKLFRGEYPGYRKCTLHFHDLKHTTDCLMAMARLIHGAFIEGVILPEREVSLGLIAALMHDTGYIQTIDDQSGTGAKYTLTHVSRSIEFCEKYFSENKFSIYESRVCHNCLKCTGLDVRSKDILKLFRGEYPGYRQCYLQFHDLKHTTDCLMAMARLIHGAFIEGVILPERDVSLGLIAALMHDTGYIQTLDDKSGTGAKYTLTHISRSIEFCEKYFSENRFSIYESRVCLNCLKCTGLDVRPKDILFDSHEHEMLAKMLGTSDLLGQMADRTYLSKLPFLFKEFKEGKVPGFRDEFELLQKTPGFWEFTLNRFATDLDGMDRFMRSHFRVRWSIDRDLYLEAIENHIKYLKFLLEHHPTDYRKCLRRGGFMRKLSEQEQQS
jgi:HD superfamily phosphodiesterase